MRGKSTIALLGAYNSGMTKVSLPITNKAGLLQVSPGNTYVGLTTDVPGSENGEPDRYYRTGKRTYARVVPKDTVQAAAMVKTMKEDGCMINFAHVGLLVHPAERRQPLARRLPAVSTT